MRHDVATNFNELALELLELVGSFQGLGASTRSLLDSNGLVIRASLLWEMQSSPCHHLLEKA
jgi:hypothetical protein